MKRINLVKMSLDILMVIIFALLYNKMVIAGLTFHEIAGLVIGGLFIIHIAINYRWVKQVTMSMFSKKLSIKTRLGYIVDIILLIAMGYIIVSGILISKVVFPNLRYGNEGFLKTTHVSASYLTLLLIGIHVGLHWDWAMNVFKRIVGIKQKKKALRLIAKAVVVVVLAFGIYNIYSANYFSRVSMIGTGFSQNQASGMHRDFDFEGTTPNGEMKKDIKKGVHDKGQLGEGGKGLANVNPLKVIASYLGIISAFSIITYYIEKMLKRKRLKAEII